MAKVVGVLLDGLETWHAPGTRISDYVTLCGLDGNDPTAGQSGVLTAPRGQKIDCEQCRLIWEDVLAMKLRKSNFA